MKRKESASSIPTQLLNMDDLVVLGEAVYIAHDDISLFCNIDWCANNLTPSQKTAVERWRNLLNAVAV